MPIAISPGVYTTIKPITSYVQEVPSSTGFIAFFSNKGPDNKVFEVTDVNKFIRLFGEPDFFKYSATYGGGQHVAFSFIQTSPKCYVMRLLPNDATFANTYFFLGMEKPVRLRAKTGTFTINVSGGPNNPGLMTVTTSGIPSIASDNFILGVFNTSDANVKLIVRTDGTMNYFRTGARTLPNAVVELYTSGTVTGTIVIDEYGKIYINGHGSVTINASNPNANGSIYVYADDIDTYLLDYTIPGVVDRNVDLNVVFNNIKEQFRPKYSIGAYTFEIGTQLTANTFNVSLRRLLPNEKSLAKQALIVPHINNSTQYYIVNVNNNGNITVTQINNNDFDVDLVRPYTAIRKTSTGYEQYNMVYDSTNNRLVWRLNTMTLDDLWDVTYYYFVSLFGVFSKYRGQYYNNYRISFKAIANQPDTFTLSVYERKKPDQEILVDTYTISFDKYAVDNTGQSIYIVDVIDRYSEDLIVANTESFTQFSNLYRALIEHGMVIQATPVDDVNEIQTPGWYYIKPTCVFRNNHPLGINFEDYAGGLVLVRNDGTNYSNNNLVFARSLNNLIQQELLLIQEFATSKRELYILTLDNILLKFTEKLQHILILNGVLNYSYSIGRYLDSGSDGALFNANNQINSSLATQLLVKAYTGQIDPLVKDTEFLWIDLVLDGGYPTDVKNAIVTLVHELRRDCIALLDNGDNRNPQEALQKRLTKHSWNSEYVAVYEPYILIYDQFSGRDIWITPIFAVARLFALNDRVNEPWYAVAGWERGTSPVIKDIRYTPKLSERDDFYLNQINPFVLFREGTVLWGNLSTRRKTDALQNVNVMRLILYAKRGLENYCKYFIFQPLDSITLEEIKLGATRFLQDLQARRGLYEFNVDIVATEYDILRKTAHLNVVLFPIRALEKIMLNFYVK